MALYKAVLNGNFAGQDIKNLLYYRTGIGYDLGGLSIGGTVDLANMIKSDVWPSMKALMLTGYTLQDITVYAYHDTNFYLLYQNPTTVSVNEAGSMSGASDTPATVAIIRFNLEPILFGGTGPHAPKRGYIAFGPVEENYISSAGTIDKTGGMATLWGNLTTALSSNLTQLIPPVVFFPVRVHHDLIAGVLSITSFADVNGCTVRDVASFRRSRIPEL